ncbi:LacI family DNA-binding transcriptional regulator [Nonomuraea endophytica]|uniref:LacI family DNA-binding transcriptional regulator n=1 Tax=Nonomuraea endophytica TaxID=714136 RepID=UPI0037C82F36
MALEGASPTLEDVARTAGVSRATVSRVINGIRNVDPVIQQTVRKAIADIGYVPNSAARSLVTRRTGSIALIVSGAGEDVSEDGGEDFGGDGDGDFAGDGDGNFRGDGDGDFAGDGDGGVGGGRSRCGDGGRGEVGHFGQVGGGDWGKGGDLGQVGGAAAAGRRIAYPGEGVDGRIGKGVGEGVGGSVGEGAGTGVGKGAGTGVGEGVGMGVGTGSGGSFFNDPFFGRVVAGVVGFLGRRGAHPTLMFAETDATRAQVVTYLRQGNADGAVLVSTHAADPLPALLVEARVPAVLFARPAQALPISYIDVDHRAGAKLAAGRLVALGRQHIATISGPLGVHASQERLAGFRDAMAAYGRPYIPSAEGGFTYDSGEVAMERLLAEYPELDGVFVANDLMAQGALYVLRHHGRRVPDDVAVIGFDDSSAATACRPPLTTVRHPVEDMAAEAARLLLNRIEQPDQPPTSVIFAPTLVVRRSA